MALLLVVPAPAAADDDAGTLDSPGLRDADDEDDEPPDEPTDEDIDQYWQEDDADEREEFLGLGGDESAGRMEELEAAAEREAEDAGEPEDVFADPDEPSADDPYAEDDEDDDGGDPFAEVTKDPYGTDEAEPAEPADDLLGLGRDPALPEVLREEPSTPPALGSAFDEDDAADGAP